MWWIRRRAFCRWLAQEGRVLMNGSGALIKETWRAPLPLSAIYEPGFRLTDADSADTLILDFLASRTVRKKKNSVVYKTPKLWYFFVIAAWTKTNMTAYVQNDYSISSLHLLNLLSKDSSSLLLILPHTIVTLIKKKKRVWGRNSSSDHQIYPCICISIPILATFLLIPIHFMFMFLSQHFYIFPGPYPLIFSKTTLLKYTFYLKYCISSLYTGSFSH